MFGGISWFGTWYKFADVVKVELGMPRINDFTQFTTIEGANFTRWGDSNWGAYVSVTPMAGLEIGGAMYVPGISATELGMVQEVTGGPFPFNLNGNGASVAASYAVPNLVTIQAMFKAIDFSKVVVIGANVTALKGMSLNAAANVDFSDSNNTKIGALASFSTTFDPIKVSVDAKILDDPTLPKNTFVYAVEGDLQYAMGMYALGAQIGYDSGVGLFTGNVGDWGGFELYPYVKANFDNGSFLKVGFLYSSGMGTDNGFATWNGVTTAQKSVIAVPVVYVWAF